MGCPHFEARTGSHYIRITLHLIHNHLVTPPHNHLDELIPLTMDRASWGTMVSHIPTHLPTRNHEILSDFYFSQIYSK